MRLLPAVLLIVLLTGCAAQGVARISYSGEFKMDLPLRVMEGGTVFSSDALSVKTGSGKLISGLVISNEAEFLSSDFDIREYPRFLLRMQDVDSLSESAAARFRNSASEIDYVYGLDNVEVERSRLGEIYTLCNNDKCLGYITKKGVSDHILSMNASGYEETEFREILTEVLRADR